MGLDVGVVEAGQSLARASLTAFAADSDSKTVAATASCKAWIWESSTAIEDVDVVDEDTVGVEVGVEDEIGAGVDVVDVVDEVEKGNGVEGSKHMATKAPLAKQTLLPGSLSFW